MYCAEAELFVNIIRLVTKLLRSLLAVYDWPTLPPNVITTLVVFCDGTIPLAQLPTALKLPFAFCQTLLVMPA